MLEPLKKQASYDDLYSIPENMIGEIIDGELVATPRPSRKHVYTSSVLGNELGPPYQFGRGGGPGGWIILDEPEIKLGEHLLVPDLAAWRKDRFPTDEETNWISVVPDWICEILSPGTIRLDRIRKMPVYAQHGVPYLWLIDPIAKTLEAFGLRSGKWVLLASFAENDTVQVEPFHQWEMDLGSLWLE